MAETGRALIERMITDAEQKIEQTEDVVEIMRLAGEDVTEETSLLVELKVRVGKYRAALEGRR
jgi:hypothetical protein